MKQLFMVLIAFILLFLPHSIISQSNFEIELLNVTHVDFQTNYLNGYVKVTFTPGSDSGWLSIGAEDEDNFDFGMIVTNQYLPSSNEVSGPITFIIPFNLTDLSTIFPSIPKNRSVQNNRTLFTLYIHFLNILGYNMTPENHVDTKTGVAVQDVEIDATNGVSTGSPPDNVDQIDNTNPPEGAALLKSVIRTDIPVIDLDNSSHDSSSSYAGDLNACTPASTSNSIKWLDNHSDDFNLPQGMTHRFILEKLSEKMKREPLNGVTTDEDAIRGRLDFFEEFNLHGVEVKYQSQFVSGNVNSTSGRWTARDFRERPDGKPTWAFLTKMIRDGEDVELSMQVQVGTDASTRKGHTVTVAGFEELDSGEKKVHIADDEAQRVTDASKIFNNKVLPLRETSTGSMYMQNGEYIYIITGIIAESPVKLDGSATAGIISELLGSGGNRSNIGGNSIEADPFMEISLHESVSDLENYLVSIYDGVTGLLHKTISLDLFTPGSNSNGYIFYYYNFGANDLPPGHHGIALSYSGSIIEYQFVSYGGNFTALDGDATQMTSFDLGEIESGQAFALSGFSTAYSGFYWINTTNTSAGDVNEGQTYTTELPDIPQLMEPVNGATDLPLDIVFSWNESQLANYYTLEIASDNLFNNLLIEQDVWGDSILVEGLDSSSEFFWRVKAINGNGASDYSEVRNFYTILVGVEDEVEIPTEYSLSQNYPNPFNPTTNIKFSIPEAENVRLTIYDALGREVVELVNEILNPGFYTFPWDAINYSSGIYFYKLTAGKFVDVKKMLLIK